MPPEKYYFRTIPRFEAPIDSQHAWLNDSLFIGTAEREHPLPITSGRYFGT